MEPFPSFDLFPEAWAEAQSSREKSSNFLFKID